MHFERSIVIDADIRTTWAIMTGIQEWPAWTESVQAIEVLTPGPLAEGTKARLELAGAPAATWTVTGVSQYRGFTWETRSRGLHIVAGHVIEPRERGVCVRLSVDFSGPAARILRPFLSRATRRNLDHEANGLKARAESLAIAIAA